MISIALAKGRILTESLPLLAKSGITVLKKDLSSRKLIFNVNEQIKLMIVRATDVPVFVEHGVADMGITGKDTLLEYEAKNIYELLDLRIACCRLMVAAKSANQLKQNTLKVATKYVRLASNFFTQKSQQIEIIKLYGTMELAPTIGLSHCIVDLVDTGNTLKENGLTPYEHIMDISARLIVNAAAYKTKNTVLKSWVKNIKENL